MLQCRSEKTKGWDQGWGCSLCRTLPPTNVRCEVASSPRPYHRSHPFHRQHADGLRPNLRTGTLPLLRCSFFSFVLFFSEGKKNVWSAANAVCQQITIRSNYYCSYLPLYHTISNEKIVGFLLSHTKSCEMMDHLTLFFSSKKPISHLLASFFRSISHKWSFLRTVQTTTTIIRT